MKLVKLVLPRVAPAQPVAPSAAPAAKLARHPASVASAARWPCICRCAMPNAFIETNMSMSMKSWNFMDLNMEILCLAQLSSRCSVNFFTLSFVTFFLLSVHQTCLRLCSPLCLGQERTEIVGTIWTSSTFHPEATILYNIHVSPHHSIIQAVVLPCL